MSVIILATFALAKDVRSDARREVPHEHPRLLGSLAELRQLAKECPLEYERTTAVAPDPEADEYSRMISMSAIS